jgi:hypothetical protein
VQSFSSSSQVKAGQRASFVIWVWSTKAAGKGVAVRVRVASATGVGSPSFTVCPNASGARCSIGSVPLQQVDELEATVKVGSSASIGEQVELTASATGTSADSFNSTATDVVIASSTASTSPTTSPSGDTTLPPVSLPPLSGSGTSSSTDPTGLFPTVAPTTTPPTQVSTPAKPHKTIRITDAAATVPLDSRLIGGQLAGLAVLAGAVAIAIVRLSLRTPKPSEGSGERRSQE